MNNNLIVNNPTDKTGLCGYVALYKGKQAEVWAKTAAAAQSLAATFFKVKKSYQVSVYLCEKDGKQVVHTPDF